MKTKLPVSVILLSYNDEALIEGALKSIAEWVAEILVVDSGSSDKTLEIARRYTDQIVSHPFENYAAQRNWAQEHLPLSHEWVFHLDADERVTPELRLSLEEFFAQTAVEMVDGLLVVRRTVFMGRWIRHGGHYPVYHLRVFRRQKGHCEDRAYDQHFVVAGSVLRIAGDLIDTITPSLDTWTTRHVRWAGLDAHQQFEAQKSPEIRVRESLQGNPIEQRRWLRARFYNRFPLFLRSIVYFIYRYFLRLGFLDGPEGLIFHVLQGFWFRFYVDAKIWELKQHEGQAQNDGPQT